jgi:hypothetical protein
LQPRPELISESEPVHSQRLAVPIGTPSRLQLATTGSFDGLGIVTMSRPSPIDDQVEIEVRATGLNFSDVLKKFFLFVFFLYDLSLVFGPAAHLKGIHP